MHCVALWCNYSLVRGRDCARAHIHTHALSPSLSLSLWLWLALSHSISHVAHSPSVFFYICFPSLQKLRRCIAHSSLLWIVAFSGLYVWVRVYTRLCVCVYAPRIYEKTRDCGRRCTQLARYIVPQLIQWRWSLSTEAQWAGLLAAHTFFRVIPQPYFTVHSVGCLQPTPSSEWFLKARTLFHLVSDWFLKGHTMFHCSLSEMQFVQDSVKKNLACGAICFINFACGSIFSSKILRQFVSDFQFLCWTWIGTRTGASLSRIRKDWN